MSIWLTRLTGWGASAEGVLIRGYWTRRERYYYINLELMAAFPALRYIVVK